ncbi:energy-coupling factor ABC transporter ATP-binding protein [Paenibacillus marinisediminis]
MINIQDLCFGYREGQNVLHGLTLHLDQRTTAIIGQNGSGKTTLVKLLKGLLKPSSGEIWVRGIHTKSVTVAQLAGKVGLVFQNPNDQIFKRTALEEVMFGPLNLKMDASTAKERALQALEVVGMSHRADANPHDLGLSEKKLISIASILAMNTDIIILDEPTIAQDASGKRRIAQIVEQLKREGKLVISILHDMDFVAEHFERTIVMNKGRVLLDGETREVFSHQELLREAALDTPYVTQLGKQWGLPETVLTAEQLIHSFAQTRKHS